MYSKVVPSVKNGGKVTLNAMSKSMAMRTLKKFSCHNLKLDPFSIRIKLLLVVILARVIIEQRIINKQNKLI